MPLTNSAVNNAVVAYVPALHAGYLSFFKKYAGADFYILGSTLVSITPRMERDIRAIAPDEALKLIGALSLFKSVSVIEKDSVKKIKNYKKIILPDEDVSRNFALKFLKKQKCIFEKVTLRWDKIISTTEFQIAPDRIISQKTTDLKFLKEAFKESYKSGDWWRQIGAVVVKNKKILFRAYNRHFPSDASVAIMGDPRSNFDAGEAPDVYTAIHAEADTVAQAARAGKSLKGLDMYMTTFPCANCARLLARAGIKRIFYAKGYSRLDAEDILKAVGVEVILVKK
jgi:dCMP deaminase